MTHEYDDVIVGNGKRKRHIQIPREHKAGKGITSRSGYT